MIIAPAVLVSTREQLEVQLKAYTLDFEEIDIDVNVADDAYQGVTTADFSDIIDMLNVYSTKKFVVHLMVSEPNIFINEIVKRVEGLSRILVLFQQESKYRLLLQKQNTTKNNNIRVGISLNPETKLMEGEFYNQFDLVQFMTVEPGAQGNDFIPSVLDKSVRLRQQGYGGIIGVDGSVNIETSYLIKKYPVDRVSVGSFFSKSKNILESKKMLCEALK